MNTFNKTHIEQQRMKSQKLQLGLTLVELMVSIVLGLIITSAVIQTYLASSQTNRVTQGVNRVQENARFAHYFVTKSLREAGFMGCASSIRNKLNANSLLYSPHLSPIFVWNYNGTESGESFELSNASADVTLSTIAGDWSTNLPSFMLGKVAIGSDVLLIQSSEKLDVDVLTSFDNDINDSNINVALHDVDSGSILLVGDCNQYELFQTNSNDPTFLSAAETGTTPSNRDTLTKPIWSKAHGESSEIRSILQTYYYIGEGASGLPSLFRFQTSISQNMITTAIFNAGTQELVEGVETLQVLLGQDTNSNGNPNRYLSSDGLGSAGSASWQNVVSSRVGMLLRSPNKVSSDIDQSGEYTILDNINFTHGDEDRVLRYPINSTVKIRNRGLNSDTSIFVCNAGTCP